jgi:hypothetical protein
LAASLLSILAGLLGLVGLVLCVTLILLPLGLLVLSLSRRLLQLAGRLVVPKALRHPVETLSKEGSKKAGKVKKRLKS